MAGMNHCVGCKGEDGRENGGRRSYRPLCEDDDDGGGILLFSVFCVSGGLLSCNITLLGDELPCRHYLFKGRINTTTKNDN